ncbi:NADPH2:quinone reductase [Kribbella aluminosa]|uniref:NADPH2:quinone reductase n=1 Tax=Kribbella aluminosa TaxID=416017 RepID=A0ABS4UCT6_9ACTN|nr:NADPH:quinone oxidoreductase family protein [Kribbella aluminosa]MBP2349456.1 NADPH2:quinone reductase [Kribbella aluminosa]
MRALLQTSLNGPQDLKLTDASVPRPGPGEVLVRVTAAGVNFVDSSQSHGTFAGGPQPPYVAGIEAAGEVVSVGAGVDLAPGMHVIGVCIGGGAFAEYAVLPAVAALPVPAGWDDEQALGLVVNWPTALAALRPLGSLAAGETVLIHAAAGATGQAAVRMAKHHGATVIATASPEKHDTVRRLGADHVLDSRSPSLTTDILDLTTGVDLSLESTTLTTSLEVTKPVTGRVVVYGLAAGTSTLTNWDLVYKHQLHVIGLNLGALIQHTPHIYGEVLTELFTLISTGVLTPTTPTTYALTDGPKALTQLESRTTTGKLALLP